MNTLRCPRCHGSLPIPEAPPAPEITVFCRSCQREVTQHVFPAVDRAIQPAAGASVAVDGGSVCFHCPTKTAVAACEGCGCYLCGDCRATWFGKTLCLNCIHSNREIRGSADFKPGAVIWDNIALVGLLSPLVFIPLYGFCLSLILSPIAIFVAIRYRKERGIVPRGPWRTMAVVFLSLLFIVGTVALIAGFALHSDPLLPATSATVPAAPAAADAQEATDAPQPEPTSQ